MLRPGLTLMLLLAPACGHAGGNQTVMCGAAGGAGLAAGAAAALPGVSPRRGATMPIPALTGRVVDNADLLSPQEERGLTKKLSQLEQATTDQLVVVSLPDLDGRTIEQVGLALGNSWGMGQKNKDNGVLLIVAPTESKVRIEVGCGLEGLLTDERAAGIIARDVLPRFRLGQFPAGIDSAVDAIVAVLRSQTRRPIPRVLKKAA